MSIDIPEGPVRFSREELAELLEMRAASSTEAMSAQLLTKGAWALRAEGENVEQARSALDTCQRQLLACRLLLCVAVLGWIVYGASLETPWVAFGSAMFFLVMMLAETAAENWPKRKRCKKPQHEPEVQQ